MCVDERFLRATTRGRNTPTCTGPSSALFSGVITNETQKMNARRHRSADLYERPKGGGDDTKRTTRRMTMRHEGRALGACAAAAESSTRDTGLSEYVPKVPVSLATMSTISLNHQQRKTAQTITTNVASLALRLVGRHFRASI